MPQSHELDELKTTPCSVCRSEKLISEVRSRLLAQNRHIRALHADGIARCAISTTLKEIRLHAGSGPSGDNIAAWVDRWIAELEAERER